MILALPVVRLPRRRRARARPGSVGPNLQTCDERRDPLAVAAVVEPPQRGRSTVGADRVRLLFLVEDAAALFGETLELARRSERGVDAAPIHSRSTHGGASRARISEAKVELAPLSLRRGGLMQSRSRASRSYDHSSPIAKANLPR